MYNEEKKITIEWISEDNNNIRKKDKKLSYVMSDPIKDNKSPSDKLSAMVRKVLEEELPNLKNNSLLYNLVLYTLTEKMKTVQTVENVLSYIKGNNAKTVQDVYFNNGEVHIKCST